MDEVITKTRVLPPRLQHNLLHRRRLTDELEAMGAARLALVVAPAGYGKTSVLIDWSATTAKAICWYTVDNLDEDPLRFIAHWIAAIRERYPAFGLQTQAALQAFAEQQVTIDQLVATAINDLYEHVSEEFLLIVDDYHLVDGVTEIGYFVGQFIQNVAPNCHVVLAARKLITLPNLTLLVARSQVAGLDHTLLAFTPDEVRTLMRRRFGEEVSPQVAEALVETTEGWVTGLLLSAQSTHVPPGIARLTRTAGVDLYDYLAQQVLDQQPPDFRLFLMRSAALEEFDVELCRAIFDDEWLPAGRTWQELMDEVLTKGLFVTAVGQDGAWLRFHRLFQEFLLYRLHTERPAEETLILRRLAALLQAERQWERAYHLYQRLQDDAAVVELVAAAGRMLVKAGRARLVERWTAALPAGALRQRPELMTIRAAAIVTLGRVHEGLNLVNQAAEELSAADDPWLARTLVWRAVILRLLGDHEAAVEQSDAALHATRAAAGDERELTEISADCHKTLGICLFKQGRLQAASTALLEAQALYEIVGTESEIAKVRLDLAMVQLAMGETGKALANLEFSAASWRRTGHVQHLSLVLNNLGLLYHTRGELVRAVELFAEALQGAERSAHRHTEALICAGLGDVLTDLAYYAAAEELYTRAAKIAAEISFPFMDLYAQLRRSWIASLDGEPADAFYLLDRTSRHVVSERSPYDHCLYQLAVGRTHLLHGQASLAVNVLERAYAESASENNVIEKSIAGLWLAAARQALGEDEAARRTFQDFLRELRELESPYFVYAAAPPIVETLRKIEVDELDTALAERWFLTLTQTQRNIRTMRRLVRQNAPEPVSQLLTAAPALQIRALGRTEVILDERYVTNADWKTLISRDLFFCLVAHPEGLTREELGAIFWPDASPSQLKTRFKNSMYRLRGAVGVEAVLYEDDLYRFNQMIDYVYDVDGFLQNLMAADRMDNPRNKANALAKAIGYYDGEYCPEIGEDWAELERQRLERLYKAALTDLAALQLRLDRFLDAIETCDAMLTLDSCWEEAHRLAMQVYAAQGNRAQVARQFDACRQALHNELSAPPSPQTERLYAELMA